MPEAFEPSIWTNGIVGSTLAFVVLALFLLRSSRNERAMVLRTSALFAFAIIGVFVSGILAAVGNPDGTATVREISLLLVGICLVLVAGGIVFRVILPRLRLMPPRILQDVLIAVGFVVWALVRLHHNKVDLSSILATSAVITAVLAFSLQDTLGNMLGGISLQVDRSIQVGDWIELDTLVGRVVEIGWRQTSIETRNWETVVVPNSVLMKNKFLVLGRRKGLPIQQRQWVYFLVEFQHAPATVIDAVEAGLRSADIPHVAATPPPNCFLVDLAGNSARYGVDYWLTNLGAKNPVDSDVRVHVHSALRRAGIPFAVPSQSVTVVEDSLERRSRRDEREVQQRLEAIRSIELFESLSADELHTLASHLRPAPFAKGDVLTRQGDMADWLYILAGGRADVFVDSDGHRAKVAELGTGSVVGEMGLMTGEPRSATVVARTPVDSFRLDKRSFRDLLVSRPFVADRISALLASRRAQLDATVETLDAEAREAWAQRERHHIKSRILAFFNLEK